MRISDWSSDVCSSDLHVVRKRAGHRQHLLLAAGEVVGGGTVALLQDGEHLQDVLLAPHHAAVAAGRPREASKRKVLRHGHAGEDATALRHVADAGTRDVRRRAADELLAGEDDAAGGCRHQRSEEHTSELQSLMRISYAVFCLKKKK